METSHYDFGMVTVDVEDNGNYAMDQVLGNLLDVDVPSKITASVGAGFFCGMSSIKLTKKDLAWYSKPENKLLIENAFKIEVDGTAKISITWLSVADGRPSMLRDGSAVWRIDVSNEGDNEGDNEDAETDDENVETDEEENEENEEETC